MPANLKKALLLLAWAPFLFGCATPYDPSPDIYDVSSVEQVNQDKAACAFYASRYRRALNTQGVATQGLQGVGSNLGLGAAGWLGPLLGGAGGILVSLAQYLGLLDTDTPKAFQNCLFQKFAKDRAAVLVEPPF